jgi:hypothetical protein
VCGLHLFEVSQQWLPLGPVRVSPEPTAFLTSTGGSLPYNRLSLKASSIWICAKAALDVQLLMHSNDAVWPLAANRHNIFDYDRRLIRSSLGCIARSRHLLACPVIHVDEVGVMGLATPVGPPTPRAPKSSRGGRISSSLIKPPLERPKCARASLSRGGFDRGELPRVAGPVDVDQRGIRLLGAGDQLQRHAHRLLARAGATRQCFAELDALFAMPC